MLHDYIRRSWVLPLQHFALQVTSIMIHVEYGMVVKYWIYMIKYIPYGMWGHGKVLKKCQL